MKNTYFITGIGTGIGKTLISAILTEKLRADYWKPVQSGDLHSSDSMRVKKLISNPQTVIHPETYRLTQPLSPHLSARLDGIHIAPEKLHLPFTERPLIVEGAGGLMVPFNEKYLLIDFIEQLKIPVILVSQHYLGSINHSLLSIEVLRQRGIPIAGIIFNGDANSDSENYILNYSRLTCLGKIPTLSSIGPESVREAGKLILDF